MDMDPDKRPTALEIIQRLDETESTDYSVSSGHAPPLWQVQQIESVFLFENQLQPGQNLGYTFSKRMLTSHYVTI